MPVVNAFLPDADVQWLSADDAKQLRTCYGTYRNPGINSECRRFIFRDLHSLAVITVYIIGGLVFFFETLFTGEAADPSRSLIANWMALPILLLCCLVEVRCHWFAKPSAIAALSRQLAIGLATLVILSSWHYYGLAIDECTTPAQITNTTSPGNVSATAPAEDPNCVDAIDPFMASNLLVVFPTMRVYPHHALPIVCVGIASYFIGYALRPDHQPSATVAALHAILLLTFGVIALGLNAIRHAAAIAQFETTSELERTAEDTLQSLQKLHELLRDALPSNIDEHVDGHALTSLVPLDAAPAACLVALRIAGCTAIYSSDGPHAACDALHRLADSLNRLVLQSPELVRAAFTGDQYWVCAGLVDACDRQADLAVRFLVDAVEVPTALGLRGRLSVVGVAVTGPATGQLLISPSLSVIVRGPAVAFASEALRAVPQAAAFVCSSTRAQLTDYVGCADLPTFFVDPSAQRAAFYHAFAQQLHHTPQGLANYQLSDARGLTSTPLGVSATMDDSSAAAAIQGPARVAARYRRLGTWRTQCHATLWRRRLLGTAEDSELGSAATGDPMLDTVEDVESGFGALRKLGTFVDDSLESAYHDFVANSLRPLRIASRWAFVAVIVVVFATILVEDTSLGPAAGAMFAVSLICAVAVAVLSTTQKLPATDACLHHVTPLLLIVALHFSPGAVATHTTSYVVILTLALVGPATPHVPVPARVAAQLIYTALAAALSWDFPRRDTFVLIFALTLLFTLLSLFVDDKLRRQHFVETRVSKHYAEQQAHARQSQATLLSKLLPAHVCGVVTANIDRYRGAHARAVVPQKGAVMIVEVTGDLHEETASFASHWETALAPAPEISLVWCVGDKFMLVSTDVAPTQASAVQTCIRVLVALPRSVHPRAVVHCGDMCHCVVGGTSVSFMVVGAAVEAASETFAQLAHATSSCGIRLTRAARSAADVDDSGEWATACGVSLSSVPDDTGLFLVGATSDANDE
eukprot:CAMPEP_0174853818 /NCGR_PEP_ID=MMETSP1114-20130205/29586_1 /TAXON_ID=312471 /ORGANISM="Neobodo designis, Strain CCAP 1951/1" /LENGTH=983 /DNA_ID=CAMNT_0016088485 /DNA_START=63 /DNA_END=3012 /DNA_ORIENTATION=+